MRAFLCLLFDLFGDPGSIAARGVLGRRDRALFKPWLRAGEAFLRRLLFIEALALPSQTPLARKTRLKRLRVRKLCHFTPDKPEEWRVSFRLLLSASRLQRGRRGWRRRMKTLALPRVFKSAQQPQPSEFSHARALVLRRLPRPLQSAPRPPRDLDDAWPFAERLEAMLRAYNAPHAAALRLARMLRRNEALALRALRPAPAHITNLFDARSFARCDAIVASRRRRWEREPARADSS
jgi:hypothetical protein